MEIKVLGTGCTKCKTLEKLTRDLVAELELDANVTKEEDIVKIMAYGIMHTPALIINEKVVFSGHIPSANELKQILNHNL